MRKEYTRITRELLDENMESLGQSEEVIIIGLWADEDKRIRNKTTGVLGTGVEFMEGVDSEDNYEEINV